MNGRTVRFWRQRSSAEFPLQRKCNLPLWTQLFNFLTAPGTRMGCGYACGTAMAAMTPLAVTMAPQNAPSPPSPCIPLVLPGRIKELNPQCVRPCLSLHYY